MRQIVPAMGDELALGDVGSVGEHDQRLDRLSPLLVRHPDHGDLDDGGMREERVLDLDRRHILATGDDHVLLAIGDGDVALVIEEASVAGVEPTAFECLGGGIGLGPIGLQDVVATGQDLALGVDLGFDPDTGAPALLSFWARSRELSSSHS